MFGRAGFGQLDGASFSRTVERLLHHLGFQNVTNVDGSGDLGADILADRGRERWIFQCKWKARAPVGETAVEEVLIALREYRANQAVVVTNSSFSRPAQTRVELTERLTGLRVKLWNGSTLEELWNDKDCPLDLASPVLRPYQADAFAAIKADLERRSRAFLVLATGLGKTVIAGNIVRWYLNEHPGATVLVVAHARALVDQLERAMWSHVSKVTPVQQLTGDERPDYLDGVTCATIQTAINLVHSGWRPGLIFIDEAHHVGDDGAYSDLLRLCNDAKVLGVTATPWRGDLYDVEQVFGGASYRLGIEEGMRLGYLCDVNYRVFVDDIDWESVRKNSSNQYSIRELNQKLFIPQRDEKIRDHLLAVWSETVSPRGIVFCQTIEHAERMKEILVRVPQWSRAEAIHNGVHKRDRQINLMNFRRGEIPLLLAVDVLNEGVDIPDVNIVCFARVTHSRRIFVQQVGRGLRLSEGKEFVTVLDFVSDLRRVAEVLKLGRALQGELEELYLPASHSVRFEDKRVEGLMAEWLLDVADVELAADSAKFDFPDFL